MRRFAGRSPSSLLAILVAALVLTFAQALELHFIDVGQGDSVLIRSPSGQTVLYDGGRSAAPVLAYLRAVGVQDIDLVIASHADADHIGGLAKVIDAYPPRFFMDNGLAHTTLAYARLLDAVERAGSVYLEPTARQVGLGEVRLQVLPPIGEESLGQNENSIGLVIEYGDFRAALTGDAEAAAFRFWTQSFPELLAPVQVYKASHHGSRNGDNHLSMRTFRPGAVVISVGAGNGYGHPTEEVLNLYRSVTSQIFRTDLHGSVTAKVDDDGSFQLVASVPDPVPTTPAVAQRQAALPALIAAVAQATPVGTEDAALGSAVEAGAPAVIIECVLFNPDGADDGRESVTLRAFERIDVSGWQLVDAADHSFPLPAATIEAGEQLVVANGGRPVWNNKGDTAYLFDSSRALIDSFSYSGRGSVACR